jgi:hypothetical protein
LREEGAVEPPAEEPPDSPLPMVEGSGQEEAFQSIGGNVTTITSSQREDANGYTEASAPPRPVPSALPPPGGPWTVAAVRDAIGPELAMTWRHYLGGKNIGPALDALRAKGWDDVVSVLRYFRSAETWCARFARNGREGDVSGPGLPFVLGKGFGKLLAECKANYQPPRPEHEFLKCRPETRAWIERNRRQEAEWWGSQRERLNALRLDARRAILALPLDERDAALDAAERRPAA